MAKAASQLAVSQPAVSKAIADMEHVLGVRLLDRGPHGAEPTHYGRALIKRSTTIFDELKQGVKEIEFLSDPTVGELRIGASEPVAAAIVSTVIEQLSRQCPRVVFHVMPGDTATLYDDLNERDVDLVITRTFEPIAEENLNTEVLFEDSIVVVAGARSKWIHRHDVTLADLINEPWILPPLDSLHGALMANGFRSAGLDVPPATVFTFSRALRESLVEAGRFLTIYPGFLMRSPTKHPWLRALSIELPGTRRPISIVTLKNRSLSPVAELFIDRVREVAKELAKEDKTPHTPGRCTETIKPIPRSPAGTRAGARRRSP